MFTQSTVLHMSPRWSLARFSYLFILSSASNANRVDLIETIGARRKYLRNVPRINEDIDIEHRLYDLERQLFEFAGAIESMRNFQSFDLRSDSTDRGNKMMSQISPIQSSLLWSPGEAHDSFGSSLKAMSSLQNDTAPRLTRSPSDLDNGRFLVGLDIREVESHQQIIVEYESLSFAGYGKSRQPIRIKFELSGGQSDFVLSELLQTSFVASANSWSKALKVTPVRDKIFPTVKTCGGAFVPSSDREHGVDEADIVIYVSSDNSFCGGAAMHSSVCDFDQFMRPLVGNINICTNNVHNVNNIPGRKYVENSTLIEYAGYVTTETGRILGASASLFRYYHNPETSTRYGTTLKSLTCVDGTQETMELPNIVVEDFDANGHQIYEIRTPRVTEIVGNHFNCMDITGARLERGVSRIGCFGSFLDDHIFYSEDVSGFELASTKGPSISPFTLALLEDSSWYEANYEVSTETSFGRGAGCQFAKGGCTIDETSLELVSRNSDFHCSEIGEVGCDPSHTYKAKCDFSDTVGHADSDTDFFCPLYTRGATSCSDSSDSIDPFAIQGEYYGESSKCFHTNRGHPMCLRGECNTSKQTIDIHYDGTIYSCYRDGQIIDTDIGLHIKCPNIAAVCPSIACPSSCSGKGFCDKDVDGKYSCICDNPYDESPGCYGP
ncbi:hypothetical protein HJC23_009646 [Cyclotella cryptica]|uniref:EGF-like domain-containing protein n=1 Tax=Cyclotella cryptica TaxID=29204 RepID=A0ABD3PWN9_9STRA|eukprot:CCRYP_010910-RA/>CCRYP_010910-RA protein AED:0.15 eAED:0.18 QI:0/0.5/0.2/1/1/1/5/102/665